MNHIMGEVHCQEQQQQLKNKRTKCEKRLTARNALHRLCCLHANILHIRIFYFSFYFFFKCLYTGSCQLPSNELPKNGAELVTQEVSVTMVTFHTPLPKKREIKLQCEIMARVIRQRGGEKIK